MFRRKWGLTPIGFGIALGALAVGLGAVMAPSVRAEPPYVYLAGSNRCDTGTVWFKTQKGPERASGLVELASGFFQTAPAPSLPVFQGASLSWTPTKVYLHLVGGGTSTVEVLSPGGAPITDAQGIAVLASAFRLTVDPATGLVIGASVEGAAYVYTTSHVYLVTVGGGLTTVEVTSPAGAPLFGVRGIAIVEGDVFDTNPSAGAVDAVVQGGALVYSGGHVFLNLVGGGLTTVEVSTPAGAPINGARGIAGMAGVVPPPGAGGMQGAAYVWTGSNVYLVLIGGGLVTIDVPRPGGGSISQCWGVVRMAGQIFSTSSGSVFQGAAQVVTKNKILLTAVGGGVVTVETTTPSGASIVTNVTVPTNLSHLHQARQLYEVAGRRGNQPGTIIGLDQF